MTLHIFSVLCAPRPRHKRQEVALDDTSRADWQRPDTCQHCMQASTSVLTATDSTTGQIAIVLASSAAAPPPLLGCVELGGEAYGLQIPAWRA